MTMRVQIVFSRPLTKDQRAALAVELGGLPGVRRIAIHPNGFECLAWAEALGSAAVQGALDAAGVQASAVRSSLPPEEDARCDEHQGERVRALGR